MRSRELLIMLLLLTSGCSPTDRPGQGVVDELVALLFFIFLFFAVVAVAILAFQSNTQENEESYYADSEEGESPGLLNSSMDSMTMCMTASKAIEDLLETKLAATGKNLVEKVSSVEQSIPSEIYEKIMWIAQLHNRVARLGISISNKERFIAYTNEIINYLDSISKK